LDLPTQTVTVNCWLVARGRPVVEGDRVIELVAGEVSVDLSAPASGRLVEQTAREGAAVVPEQVLGVIETDEA
jgi:pyruvate/2-oxoglutarate dehydrogenase complex dihydrolipoamide acyltransferase (E2) component